MYKIPEIFERSSLGKEGANYYTEPSSNFLNSESFKILKTIPNGIKEVVTAKASKNTTGELDSQTPENNTDNISSLLSPPSDKYTVIVPPEGEEVADQIENLVTKQFIQQFYENYMVPVGTKDVYNRLGEIAGNVDDVHALYPNGVKGLIASDSIASWRANVNYSFKVNEGISGVDSVKYSSLGFPPFISHETVDTGDLLKNNESVDTAEDFEKSQSFDMDNVLYKRNKGTFRFPAFKQINDNIHLLQVFLNRCFGIESTYMNEWDLSLYMQEGLCSFIEKTDTNGDTIRLPQFVTTLTYGLLDDAPIDVLQERGKNDGYSDVDIDKVSTFASVNMAISTRYGIDNQPLGQQANDTDYIINNYPYSAYWYPADDGATKPSLNMSYYISNMFAYELNGLPFDEKNPAGKWYTPKIYHGEDLSKSTRRFLDVLHYEDNRHAVLSGWNSTDDQGDFYLKNGDTTNNNTLSNAYSYLPFWKQFFTDDTDGLSEVDLYWQEVIAAGKPVSILNAAYQIISQIAGNNDIFNDVCSEANQQSYDVSPTPAVEEDGEAIDTSNNMVIPSKYGTSDSYSDYSFSLFKCKLSIPGSKLLKMFLNKRKSKSKAMSMASSAGTGSIGASGSSSGSSNSSSGTSTSVGPSVSPSAAIKNTSATKSLGEPKTIVVDGQEVEVDTYVPEESSDLCSKKTVGEGIAEYSPFIYGGPHGKYFSPNTLEGYTQYNNQNLATVPTVDIYSVFSGIRTKTGLRGFEFSKNFKLHGSYIDTVTCLTPNERESLLKSTDKDFGVKNLGPNTAHWVRYYSQHFVREYFHDWWKYWTIRIWFCKIRVPNYRYWKLARLKNSGDRERWLWKTNDYGTGAYITKFDTGRTEYGVSYQTDWTSQDFKLLPTCGWINIFNTNNVNGDNAWTSEQVLSHIRHDQDRFRKPTSWYISDDGKIIYNYNASTDIIRSDCVKYLIVPSNISGSPTCSLNSRYQWVHASTYGASGTTWGRQLKNMYNAGTTEMSVTLPIKDTSGNIIDIVCGVANIYKSIIDTWRWVLHASWHRRRRHWCHCHHYRWCRHWYWSYERVSTDVYNLYFRPNLVQWNLPTSTILNKEAIYADQRNKETSNIVERWSTDGAKDSKMYRFSHIGTGTGYSPSLFPFTEDFMNKYGFYEPNTLIPGVSTQYHTRRMNGVKVLHTKGFYWQDILKSYREDGQVETIASVKTFYNKWDQNVTYMDNAAGYRYDVNILPINSVKGLLKAPLSLFRKWFSRIYEIRSYFNVTRKMYWTAYTPEYRVVQKTRQNELTKILNDSQCWPAVQEYQIGDTPYMTWYKPIDTIDVYIDTVTQQIAWLNQLKEYADKYLSDSLIWEVYSKSVDNLTKETIEHWYNGDDYLSIAGGWTSSYTEDVNYSDALAIVRKVFKTSDSSKNTIYDLTSKRIDRLTAFKEYAVNLKKDFTNAPTDNIHKFMRLVTNTKNYLDCATSSKGDYIENSLFDNNGDYTDTLFEIDENTTFNLLKNPASVLWAYMNVLYHVRKYWINLRMNKRSGSYWTFRGLERVMVFMLAQDQGEDTNTSPNKHVSQGTSEELKAKNITYVQPRTSFVDRAQDFDTINVTCTQAVYVKVNYLGTPTPTTSDKWNEETQRYDGDEITYINETYRWARKPQDGLYYVMSETITNNVQELQSLLTSTINTIATKEYTITEDDYNEIISLIKTIPQLNISYDTGKVDENNESILGTYTFTNSKVLTCLAKMNISGNSISTIESYIEGSLINEDISTTELENIFKIFLNRLISYKREYYLNKIQSLLYPVYIKWQPKAVWTGLREDDTKGAWHIDEWQKEDTLGVERKVTDLYGYEHSSSDAIVAGITFNVSTSLNPSTLLSSPNALRNSTLLEILCSSVNNIDLWRIEIPEDLNIPVTLLEKNPKLVPAYQIDATVAGLKASTPVKTTKTVLAGVSSNSILPVLEPTEDMLTINSLSALGEFKDISSIGLSLDSIKNSGN